MLPGVVGDGTTAVWGDGTSGVPYFLEHAFYCSWSARYIQGHLVFKGAL